MERYRRHKGMERYLSIPLGTSPFPCVGMCPTEAAGSERNVNTGDRRASVKPVAASERHVNTGGRNIGVKTVATSERHVNTGGRSISVKTVAASERHVNTGGRNISVTTVAAVASARTGRTSTGVKSAVALAQ
jgi:hypothetical protein